MAEEIDSCAVAHGDEVASQQSDEVASQHTGASQQSDEVASQQGARETSERTLVAVFASAVSGFLLRYGADAGYRGLLVEPDADRAAGAKMAGFSVTTTVPEDLEGADIVVTDHHRDELGVVLRDALTTKARWIGVMGNPRHPAPHIPALEALGVPPGDIARVHRPIGLNIGSRIPPEIAVSTLAGLIADRNSRPGGFDF
jgi:xanthine dehydrogenase accessory factor